VPVDLQRCGAASMDEASLPRSQQGLELPPTDVAQEMRDPMEYAVVTPVLSN